ncbi:hypothetical protein KP509_12G034100 [Ceratopteris richardii]|nr:hypothetical protein KP509_12G034100 [Ceratopteris richardii]
MHSASQLRGGNTGQLQQKKKDMDTCNHESSRCFGEKLSGIDPENERIDRDQSSRNHQNNRKLLNQKSSTQERTNKTTNITSTHSETGAPFHLDYSSPQTHPPTSN